MGPGELEVDGWGDDFEEEPTGWLIAELPATYGVVRDYTDLRVWHLGIDLSVEIYRVTAAFPMDERFGLVSQLRRASVSVPSTIAEGNARNTTADYLRFLRISRGSLAEIKTQLVIATRLGLLTDPDATTIVARVDELTRRLTALYRAIERSNP